MVKIKIFVFLIICFYANTLNAQVDNNSSLLDKVISVQFSNEKFEDVLKSMSKVTGLNISYSRNNINYDKLINYKANNEKAADVLKSIAEMGGAELIITENNEVIIRNTPKRKVNIKGKVIDKKNNEPLIGVNVIIKNTQYGAATDEKGNYIINNIPSGNYDLLFNYIGYENGIISDIDLVNDATYDMSLNETSIKLGDITVTPGSFSIIKNKSYSMQVLSREDIQNMSFGEDVYRAITRLPGVSGSDFSSKFTIRGGEGDEILVQLDGMELNDPFHVKDILGGALSIVDAAVIGGADVLTGGFTSEYGDKMSGVFNITSLDPVETRNKFSASLSLMNARLMSQGSFDDKKGSWIVSARRGYLDFVLGLLDERSIPNPTYYDVYTKGQYKFNNNHKLSFNMLFAGDNFYLYEDDLDSTDTKYFNTHSWLNLSSVWNNELFSETILYFNNYDQTREGVGYSGNEDFKDFDVVDKRDYNMFGFKQNWIWDYNSNIQVKFGYDYNYTEADYDYKRFYKLSEFDNNGQQVINSYQRIYDISPKGSKHAGYLSLKTKLLNSLTAETGIRYDYNSYTDHGTFSPRINLAYQVGKSTFLRSGFGYFYQSQGLHEIRVQHGETNYFPSELAKHYVAGVEHSFNNGLNLRIEGYYKDLSNVKPAYRNYQNDIEMFPEASFDVLALDVEESFSKGIETFVKYDKGGLFSFWASYAYSISKDKIGEVTFNDGSKAILNDWFFRPNDQTHTINFDFNFRPAKDWHINLAWQYRTGWAYTDRKLGSYINAEGAREYIIYLDKYHGTRLPDYHRLDLRVSRMFNTSFGTMNIFVELLNAYNRDNVRAIDVDFDFDQNGNPVVTKEKLKWLPLIPSIGVRLDF